MKIKVLLGLVVFFIVTGCKNEVEDSKHPTHPDHAMYQQDFETGTEDSTKLSSDKQNSEIDKSDSAKLSAH